MDLRKAIRHITARAPRFHESKEFQSDLKPADQHSRAPWGCRSLMAISSLRPHLAILLAYMHAFRGLSAGNNRGVGAYYADSIHSGVAKSKVCKRAARTPSSVLNTRRAIEHTSHSYKHPSPCRSASVRCSMLLESCGMTSSPRPVRRSRVVS